jgi:dihydrodipicolinate synthase/N-acetylneuraminate lyase
MQGVHAAILTHFDDRLQIDHQAVAAQVERLIAAGIRGIVACGTMGEATSLSAAERAELLSTAVGAAAGRVSVCAGISAPSAAQAIAYARDAVAASARFDVTSKLVQYFKAALDELGIGGGPCRPPRLPLTDRELEHLRGAVANASAVRAKR